MIIEEDFKIIPISLDFNDVGPLNKKIDNTKKSFWTKDVGCAFLEFSSDISFENTEVSLIMENTYDLSCIQKTLVNITSSPFYYQLGDEILHDGFWIGQITISVDNVQRTSRPFSFVINKSVGDGTFPRLEYIENLENMTAQLTVLRSSMQEFLDSALISENLRNETIASFEERITNMESFTGVNSYVFDQIAPLDTWYINHGLNRHPSVTVVDSSGTQVVGDIFYQTSNQIIVSFSSEFSGKAFLN